MSLHQLNLNDLIALEALLVERHVTRAARRCGLSQSAMSHALRRLRTTLDDPLLVRGQSGLVLTPRAGRLVDVVCRTLTELQRALFADFSYDPKTSERVFQVACVDLVVVSLLVPLMRIIEREAPRASVDVRPLDTKRFLQQLEQDVLDVALIGPEATPGMSRSHLYNEELVCVLHADHPATRRPWTIEGYRELRHAIIAPNDVTMQALDQMLARHGVDLQVALRVPYFVAGSIAATLCDLALLVPRTLAASLAKLMPIVIRELPFRLPLLAISLIWHPKNDGDAAVAWLRNTITHIFADTGGHTFDQAERSSSRGSAGAHQRHRTNQC